MVNPDAVARRLLILNECLGELARPEAAEPQQLAANSLLRAAVERWLQMAIEACIDIASHVIACEGWAPPASGKDAFLILANHGRLTLDLAQRLGRAAGMRNVLVHDYLAVDLSQLAHIVEHDLGDLREFAVKAATWLGEPEG
jgi:uncharacterized protein YutE (UPF0331/DUF86 family)